MCLPIDCWLCTPRTDDDHYHAPPNKHGAQRNYNGNGGHYYNNGNTYHAHGAVAGVEADRKASNDVNVRRGPAAHAGAGAAATRGWHGHGHGHAATAAPAHAVPTAAGAGAAATRGWHGHAHAATATQEKQADGTLKPQPVVARNDKVAAADGARGVAHNNYYYEQPPAHKEDATADHERY